MQTPPGAVRAVSHAGVCGDTYELSPQRALYRSFRFSAHVYLTRLRSPTVSSWNDRSVTQAEFHRGAAGVLRRTETEGPIVVLDEQCRPAAIVSAPRDEPLSHETLDASFISSALDLPLG
jgi:hypothetical protein